MFKVGDKVKCIDGVVDGRGLTPGKIYRVTDYTKSYVTVMNDFGNWEDFYFSRFELVKTTPVQKETTASAAGNTVKSIIQSMEVNGPKKLSVKIDNYVITIKKND